MKSSGSGCLPVAVILVLMLAAGGLWELLVSGGDSHAKHVTRSDYGSYWPLTADSATIGCKSGDPYVQVGDTRYALNGAAQNDGYVSLAPIWADDSASPGLKVDVSVLRINALKLC